MSSDCKKSKHPKADNLNFGVYLESKSERPCRPVELIKNGGFEIQGTFSEYANWEETLDKVETLRIDVPYEGLQAAQLESVPTENPEVKRGSISQKVIVPPGCHLMLSFAEELWEAGENFAHLFVRARVFYDSTDLINIEINRRSFQARTGYAFHQKISDDPVPQNVSSVTVQFEVEIVDTEDTSLLLDGVSLRAI